MAARVVVMTPTDFVPVISLVVPFMSFWGLSTLGGGGTEEVLLEFFLVHHFSNKVFELPTGLSVMARSL